MNKIFGDQTAIPCSIYRGGSSKGILFLETDLPRDIEERTSTLLRVMGSPDARQIDGLGGADPLTSRIGILSKTPSGGILFQFALAHIEKPIIEFKGFCGNIISAAAPFAIDHGLVPIKEPITEVRIFDINTKMEVVAEVAVQNGKALSKGDFYISGVPNPGSKIKLRFYNPCGLSPKTILPTGKACDHLDTSFGVIEVSLINCIDPVIFVNSRDIGLQGIETPQQLANNLIALKKLKELRTLGAKKMDMPCSGYLPKIVFISPSSEKGSVTARMLSLEAMHKAYAVSTGSCTAAAAYIPDSLINRIFIFGSNPNLVKICHPLGKMEIEIKKSSNQLLIEEIAVFRTARCIMKGHVFI